MTTQALTAQALAPEDVTEWLRGQGWSREASLGDIAQGWRRGDSHVMVPTLTSSPDFPLRWTEMLTNLSRALATDAAGVLLAVAKAGSDIAEFRASGQIDDTLPLGDASTLIESVRRAIQASANSALQPRSYFGHSVPDAARLHASGVRMAQTRHGSYIVPVISRLPILKPDDADDALLFEEVEYQPFARRAMLRLAEGLTALHELTHGASEPTPSSITEAVGVGVSSELCDAVANTLDTSSIADLHVAFGWAERLPARQAPTAVTLAGEASGAIRQVAEVLKGSPVVGRQTIVGYVKRLDRGEEDEVGRVTLRALDNDKARNISLELNDADYHVAGEANTERRVVSATGILHREPGRALRFSEVSDFRLMEQLSLASANDRAT
ncbi:MAG: hypothetical protein ACOYBY_08430 [Dermatophilaceae bacterium]